MNYAIEVLEKEKEMIELCLSEWELNHYPEARKQRSNRLKDLTNSINKLK